MQCSNGLQSQIDTSLSFFNSVLVACTEPVCRESYASELCSIYAYQTCEFITLHLHVYVLWLVFDGAR